MMSFFRNIVYDRVDVCIHVILGAVCLMSWNESDPCRGFTYWYSADFRRPKNRLDKLSLLTEYRSCYSNQACFDEKPVGFQNWTRVVLSIFKSLVLATVYKCNETPQVFTFELVFTVLPRGEKETAQ
jgi:hypothetical protein